MSAFKNVVNHIGNQATSVYSAIINPAQEYLNTNCWELNENVNSGKDKKERLLSYLDMFVKESKIVCTGYSNTELVNRLYSDICEYSILTPALENPDIEEININAWNNIQAKHSSGKISRLEPFASPMQAIDIVSKLLRQSNITFDKGKPRAEAHIGSRVRITAIRTPLVDEEVGVCASIRKLSECTFKKENYLANDFASEEELDFLGYCLRYGVSAIIAGKVNSGKTTFTNFLVSLIPDNKRVYTIEKGAREVNLVKHDADGVPCNNVVHTLTRPSEQGSTNDNITEEVLVELALRFDPDVIVNAECRGTEAYAAQEASLTGHTVITTLHAGSPKAAHNRIANLCRKKYPIDYQTANLQACEAFPLVVFVHQTDDYVRRIMEVSEVIVDGVDVRYNTLYRFKVLDNEEIDGVTHTVGKHIRVNPMSKELIAVLIHHGMPSKILNQYTGGDSE